MKTRVKAKPAVNEDDRPGLVFPPGVDGVLTARHIVAMLDISERKFKQMLSAGEYPAHDFALGKLHRWTVATHNEWVRRQGKGVNGGGG